VIELVDGAAPAVARLRQVAALRAALDAAEAQAILDLATEVDWDEDAEFDVVGTRPVRIGSDGSRLVDEFVPLEVAAVHGCSAEAATWLVRDVVNLHARHPATWQAVQQGWLPLWRARQVAQYAATLELSKREALAIDELLRPALGRVQWKRLWWLLRAAVLQVAPDRVRAVAERSRAARFVRTGCVADDPTASFLAGRVDTCDALGFDHLLDEVADALRAAGEPGTHEQLRARALGLLAEPERVLDLLRPAAPSPLPAAAGGDDAPAPPVTPRRSRRRPVTRLYVHVTAGRLAPDDLARVEGRGPVLVDQLRHLTGGAPIRITPVVHAGGPEQAVDTYEIPAAIRTEVVLRDRFEVFPFSGREARRTDLDHTIPYRAGVPAQTRASNLGPLARRSHRGKTHGGWQLYQPRPGTFWWRSPRGQVYRVGTDGTRNLTPGDPAGGPSGAEQLMLWQIDRRLGEDRGEQW